MGFSVGKGSASWNKQVQPASLPPPIQVPPPCHLAPPPPLLEPGREESSRRLTKGPTSWRSSPGNKWRALLGGSDSETAMAWRPAVTHSTSMGELSVEAENTKALFFPSFLFFLSFLPSPWRHCAIPGLPGNMCFSSLAPAAALRTGEKTRPKTEREQATRGTAMVKGGPLLHCAQVPVTFPGNTNIPKEHLEWRTHRIVDLGEKVEYVSSNIFIYR